MKKLINLFLILLVASFIHGQEFTFAPNFYAVEISATDAAEDKKFGYTMENTSDEAIVWYWSVDVPEDFPEEWEFQICDLNLCYAFGNVKSSNNIPNTLGPGESTNPVAQYINIRPNGVPGESHLVFNIYAGQDCTDLLYSTSDVVSSNDVENPRVSIFPNPTTDIINLKNDDGIATVEISSLNGQSVYKANHQVGQSHSVETIPTGMYIISLYNSADRLVKMQQLYKK